VRTTKSKKQAIRTKQKKKYWLEEAEGDDKFEVSGDGAAADVN
jgi:hypothetical protein